MSGGSPFSNCPSPRERQGCPGKETGLQPSTAALLLIVLAGLVRPSTPFLRGGQDDFTSHHAPQRELLWSCKTFPGQPCRKRGEGGVGAPLRASAGGEGQPVVRSQPCLWIGSIQRTCSGRSTGSMSRLTTTASLSLRTNTHSSVSSVEALISWCGT